MGEYLIYIYGFLDGVLIIPSFILEELQHIADSGESHRREKGRRGLEELKKFQTKLEDRLVILNKNVINEEVDHKLITLADEINAELITNDFNLAKLAELQGIKVLNVNKLANSLKPALLPGDEVTVRVVKEGEDRGQGIAYFDDGTMVVVEHGKYHIGKKIDVLITSILQKDTVRCFLQIH
ncbi:MAG: TRAM domain-containing protein [Firmicutes bacterium]|nr:TRAM domain-containing protein [Bacillota bacterium]